MFISFPAIDSIILQHKVAEILPKKETFYENKRTVLPSEIRPPPKPRLWYTNNLIERSLRWWGENEEPSPLIFYIENFEGRNKFLQSTK